MASRTAATRMRLIDEIIDYAKKHHPAAQFSLLATFIREYYNNVPLEDITTRSTDDIYHGLLSHWELIYQRKPKECKIRVFNPTLETDCWLSHRTIIEIIQVDMPFLVDSMRMALSRLGYSIHLVVYLGGLQICRDSEGRVLKIMPFDVDTEDASIEAPIYMEIDKELDPQKLKDITENIRRVLRDVDVTVKDWELMKTKVESIIQEINETKPPLDPQDLEESMEFLRWLLNDHFTFLGFREYRMVTRGKEQYLEMISKSGLGVLRDESKSKKLRPLSELPPAARKRALSKELLIISKTNTRSTVHRPTFTDYLGIKRFNHKGELIGEYRFIGLYTKEYLGNPLDIPYIREKVKTILKKAGLAHHGHASNTIMHILETLPRDDLFQASVDELSDIALGVWQLQERRLTRLFVLKDAYNRYFSCYVYIPRENFNTDLLKRIQLVLVENLQGFEVEYSTFFSESILARIHFVIRIKPDNNIRFNLEALENKIVNVGRSWGDSLRDSLYEKYSEDVRVKLFERYQFSFPAGYREVNDTFSACYDISHIERLLSGEDLGMSFYRPPEADSHVLRFKLFQFDKTIPLSDAIPLLENMGLRIIGEAPYEIMVEGRSVWLNDFQMEYPQSEPLDVSGIRETFHEAFYQVWKKSAENDSFNRLVLLADLSWREISVIRAYAKYLRQAGLSFSQDYVEQAICNNPDIARMLIAFFRQRFHPEMSKDRVAQSLEIKQRIEKALDKVSSLDEDRIIRRFLIVILATLRTNFYQKAKDGNFKPYISFKIDPSQIPDIPLPIPLYETFVCSPRVEGVHLRNAKVARGGIRWSDRKEDYRVEVLGLMKAQHVKNAVIVPGGAKGGFITKLLPIDGSREAILEEGIACYQAFICGLLDLVDNILEGKIIKPENSICYDGDDPYLVVAADKGTATFSDIANSKSEEYNFWLSDAFASGGSVGYDHKKIGITARGAWESVKSHFQEMSLDPHKDEFTVVGIGDMSGDVFGNGLIISDKAKLIAAFNHMHIFIDPNPHQSSAYRERLRLYSKPRSSWADYDPKLISRGGGVFMRSAKSIKLTKEIKKFLNVTKDSMEPNELIRSILCAPVDLLWNGGIGTYVKASTETNLQVIDRANDNLRVNGCDLRTKIVAEGGNLGFTQMGRIEYEKSGGRINTDFIDNSGGVDCSDREVNIKILFNSLITKGVMSLKQRNQLLSSMTDDVAKLVLYNNYRQARSISYAASQSLEYLELYRQFMDYYEHEKLLPRDLEFLPDDKVLHERKALMRGLTRSEIAVLTAYSKIFIKQSILNSDLPEDPHLFEYVEMAFPERLRGKYKKQMHEHRLHRELIATQLSNEIVTHMGITFIFQMKNETGEPAHNVIRAYVVSRCLYNMPSYISMIENLDHKVSTDIQIQLRLDVTKLIRRSTRWFLRNRKDQLDIKENIKRFAGPIKTLWDSIPNLIVGSEKEYFDVQSQSLMSQKIPQDIAEKFALLHPLYSALNIVEAATSSKSEIANVGKIYYFLMERLDLIWFREQINAYPINNHWAAQARAAIKGDLDSLQRKLVISVLKLKTKTTQAADRIDAWLSEHQTIVLRWHYVLGDIRSTNVSEYSMLSVAMRELLDLTDASKSK